MAAITSFTLVPKSLTGTSAQFAWTLNLDGNLPVSGTYKLTIGALNQAVRYDVTFTKPPYTFSGLRPGEGYTIFLQLTLNGVQQGGEATIPITTPASGGSGGGATPEFLVGNYAVTSISDTSVTLDWILNAGPGTLHDTSLTFTLDDGKGRQVSMSPQGHPYTFAGLEPNTTYAFTYHLDYDAINIHQSQTITASTRGYNWLSAIGAVNTVGSITTGFAHGFAIDARQKLYSIVRQGPQPGSTALRPWNLATALAGVFYTPTGAALARARATASDNFVYENIIIASLGTDKAAYTYNNVGLVGLGGSFAKPLVMAGLPSGEVYLLGIGAGDGLVNLRTLDLNLSWSAHWIEYDLKTAPGGPYDFDTLSSAICVNANQVDVAIPVYAAKRKGGTQTTLIATTTSSGWSVFDLDFQSYADVTLTSCAPGRLDVIAVGTNGHLYHRSRTGTTWAAWEDVGTTNSTWAKPAADSWGANRIDVVVVGSDSSLYHKWYDGTSWSPAGPGTWDAVGGKLATPVAPVLVAPQPNWLEVFVKGTDAGWYTNSWNGSKWEGWTSHSVKLG